MVVPLISTFYPLFSTHLPMYSWRFLYSLWASLLHPLIICSTVSVEFPHNLPSGVSEVLSKLCLIEFVLKACSWAARIKPNSASFFKKPFLSHLQESSPATSAVCHTKSPCRAFSLQFLIFSSCLLFWYSRRFSSSSNTFSFKAACIHSVVFRRSMQGLTLLPCTLLSADQPCSSFLPRQVQSSNITSGAHTSIHC